MSEARSEVHGTSTLGALSTALVRLHKEQFGRGPTQARTEYAGRDALLCVLESALLPAERAMVEVGEDQRVREQRVFLQAATADLFVGAVEEITGRKVRAFSSAVDPAAEVVFEVFALEPEDRHADSDGHRPIG
jgi:uncharacterized protein YbcI